MVVYNLDELSEYLKPIKVRKGFVGIGTNIHNGHRELFRVAREKSDFVISAYYNTFDKQMESVFPEHVQGSNPLNKNVLDELESLSDVVILYTDGYTSFEGVDLDIIKNICIDTLPDSSLPKQIVELPKVMAALRIGQIMKYIQMQKISYDIQVAGQKESFRAYMKQWVERMFGNEYYLVDTIKDKDGNIYSSSRPKELKIDRVLIQPWMKRREQLEEYISDINGLKVIAFVYDEYQNRIFVSFQYGDDPHKWWTEGIKAE